MTAAMPVPTYTDDECWDALSLAKIDLMGAPDVTFYIHCILSLSHQWDDTLPTAATDGETIWYNRSFFMGLPRDERVGLILHETLHVIFLHMLRAMGFDFKKYNMAADYVINLIVVELGFKLPACGLYDIQYKGMHTEEVYALLQDDPSFQPDLIEPGQGDPGDGGKEIQAQEVTAKVDRMLVAATVAAQAAGDDPGRIPGEIAAHINELLHPKIRWDKVLRRYYTKFSKTNYNYRRPNRRYLHLGLIMPSRHGKVLKHGAIGWDLSGSVTDAQATNFAEESYGIFQQAMPKFIELLVFDTTIRESHTIKDAEDLKQLKPKARGGTRIEPLMKWADEHRPDWLIVFTDGKFSNPVTKPRCPVIWLIHSNPNWKPPFGQMIEYNFD